MYTNVCRAFYTLLLARTLYLSVQRVCYKIGTIYIHAGSEHYIVISHSRGVTGELAWEFIAQGPLRSAHIVQVGQILWGEEYQLKRREETGREERKGNRERELEEE
jgi:hypothetical protein